MFRNIIILLVIVIAFLIIRSRWRARQQNKHERSGTAKHDKNENTVQCEQCKLYLPADEAVTEKKMFFCSEQHQRDWHKRSSD